MDLGALAVLSWGFSWMSDRLCIPLNAILASVCAVIWGNGAIILMLEGGYRNMVITAAISAWHAWVAWSRRKPRRRNPSRVTGRVRDLGHRLVVTPA